ncbi:MAG: protein BatD [Flavobacteriales bacterium]|nr:protein BatD [Flavobacteriales bacterium]
MRRGSPAIIALVLAFSAALPLVAQEISFTASVDRNAIAAGDQVRLTITLANSQERFTPPDLGGLVVVAGPHESSSFNFINGRTSSTVTRTWVLSATQPGKYTIGPARVKVGRGTIETESITIEVSKGQVQGSDPAVQRAQQGDPNLFIIVSLNRSKAYVGEPVVASYHLYNRYTGLEAPKSEPPQLNGFWSEELNTESARWEEKVVNGIGYRVILIKQQLLFPQRSGKLRIEPMTLNCIVNRNFFNRGTAVDVRSNAVEFTALPLPGGAPADFSGAVGELTLEVQADRKQVKVNEAIEVTVRLSGRSNLKLVDAPKLSFPSDLESYEPKVTDKISVSAQGMSGSRGFQYTVIPRHEGRYDLGAIDMSYFDTRTGTYKSLRSEPLVIDVAPGDASTITTTAPSLRSDVVALDSDIRFIRSGDARLRLKGHGLFGSWPWVAGMSAPGLLFIGFTFWDSRRRRLMGDAEGLRRSRAEKAARRRLQEAAAALKQGQAAPFYAALSKAMHGYVADKFGLGIADVNERELRRRMGHTPDGDEVSAQLLKLIAHCDMARFAPVEDQPRAELYEEALVLIQRIERFARA